jgi:Mrp family chromosome partitioning ATPase
MKDAINKLKDRFDLVLIDTPFIKEYRDAFVVSATSDGIVFVIDTGSARRPIVRLYIEEFKDHKILGAVFNKRRYPIPEIIYRHT